MKKFFLFSLFLLFLTQLGIAQQKALHVKQINETDSLDMYNVLHLLGIDIVKFKLSKEFYNHRVNLVIDEYTNGEKKEFFSSAGATSKIMPELDLISDSLEERLFELKFYNRKTDTVLKQYINFVKTGFEFYLSLKRGKSYSVKDVYNLDSNNYKIVLGEKFPVWTYTQPVGKQKQLHRDKDNISFSEFCFIGSGKIPFTDWYKTFGIEHFFIFSIVVEKVDEK